MKLLGYRIYRLNGSTVQNLVPVTVITVNGGPQDNLFATHKAALEINTNALDDAEYCILPVYKGASDGAKKRQRRGKGDT